MEKTRQPMNTCTTCWKKIGPNNTGHLKSCEFSNKVKTNPAAQQLGKLGGQATSKKYGKEQLKEWGKLGGRPRKKRPVEIPKVV